MTRAMLPVNCDDSQLAIVDTELIVLVAKHRLNTNAAAATAVTTGDAHYVIIHGIPNNLCRQHRKRQPHQRALMQALAAAVGSSSANKSQGHARATRALDKKLLLALVGRSCYELGINDQRTCFQMCA